MSSRLFQEIREERGLAYTRVLVDVVLLRLRAGHASTPAPHRSTLDEVLTVLDDVIDGILADGITDEEHRVAVGYLEGSMLLGLEDTGSRMARLGGSMIVRGEVTSIDDHVERIRAVTLDDVARVLRPGLHRTPHRRRGRVLRRRRSPPRRRGGPALLSAEPVRRRPVGPA